MENLLREINWEVMPISYETFISLSEKILGSLFTLAIGYLTNKFLKKLIKKFSSKREKMGQRIDDKTLNTLNTLLGSVVKYLIYFIMVFNILKIFNVPVESLLTVAGVGSVAIGFGAQSLVKDIIAGFFTLLEGEYAVGEKVEIQGKIGIVEALGIRATRIKALDGSIYIIPNGEIKTVTNLTQACSYAVVDLRFKNTHDSESILKILDDEMQKTTIEELIEKPTVLGITELGITTITIRITANCKTQTSFAVERELRRQIKNRLQKEKIW